MLVPEEFSIQHGTGRSPEESSWAARTGVCSGKGCALPVLFEELLEPSTGPTAPGLYATLGRAESVLPTVDGKRHAPGDAPH